MLRVPVSTYRFQLNLQFRFSDARELVPYLNELGITDLYASPRFQARKGSMHGYDVTDPRRVSSELGTENDFAELSERLKSYSMGLLLDIVPNHMAASHENPWWMDVLENGPSSPYADYFDIDWHPSTTKAAFLQDNRVLLPFLGDLYGTNLENCELILKLDEAGFFIQYFEHRFPLDPKSYEPIVVGIAENLAQSCAVTPAQAEAVSKLLEAVRGLPPFWHSSPEEQRRRIEEAAFIKDRLWQLCQSVPEVRQAADSVIRSVNGSRENPSTLLQLDRILSAQPYRLAYWKIGLEEVNYRRFFGLNEFVAVRVEDPRVFDDRHRAIFQLVRDTKVTGLRIDHVDGLFDPRAYLDRLQSSALPESNSSPQPLFVVIEKILGGRERLPDDWPVSGTTGYDFLNAVNALFVDPDGLNSIEEAYARVTRSSIPFADVSYTGNMLVMETLFAHEVHSLGHLLGGIAAQDRKARDLPMAELIQLLKVVTACLPVYRTYIRGEEISDSDREFLEKALTLARARVSSAEIRDAAFAFFRQILFLNPPDYAAALRAEYLQFVMRWQQFTGPVMAKGLEDTASYLHNSLISIADVGTDPTRECLPLGAAALHEFNQYRQMHWPRTLNTTSTHDTKRGADVRARINVLSEIPREWERFFRRARRSNAPHRKLINGMSAPDPGEESLLYQTMLGAWPASADELPDFCERIKAFFIKAVREAKLHTNWFEPNAEYESALLAYVDAIFGSKESAGFLPEFLTLQKKVAFYGCLNSLSQVLLKIASPGLPDFYQGEELWDLNLVDPDNRRPVDFALRGRLLDELKHLDHENRDALLQNLISNWPDGRIKLYLIWKALNFRRDHRDLFELGEYLPLETAGKQKENLFAFARRRLEGEWVIAVVPRMLSRVVDFGQAPLGRDVWGAASIQLPAEAPNQWRDAITGQELRSGNRSGLSTLRAADLFRRFPVALCAPIDA
ncbi:MAG TPA: malto-oligosyltrehalose synthase [Candidatus Dormibacteraeota bacterium]|nr:malto-oligosyltrehalose synthase [Candidatus Dormibacteraeota bacterium]